jgi:hypothetical protein
MRTSLERAVRTIGATHAVPPRRCELYTKASWIAEAEASKNLLSVVAGWLRVGRASCKRRVWESSVQHCDRVGDRKKQYGLRFYREAGTKHTSSSRSSGGKTKTLPTHFREVELFESDFDVVLSILHAHANLQGEHHDARGGQAVGVVAEASAAVVAVAARA